jgi:hypothetical protein
MHFVLEMPVLVKMPVLMVHQFLRQVQLELTVAHLMLLALAYQQTYVQRVALVVSIVAICNVT